VLVTAGTPQTVKLLVTPTPVLFSISTAAVVATGLPPCKLPGAPALDAAVLGISDMSLKPLPGTAAARFPPAAGYPPAADVDGGYQGAGGYDATRGGGREVSRNPGGGTFKGIPTGGGMGYKFGCIVGGGICMSWPNGSDGLAKAAGPDDGTVDTGGAYAKPPGLYAAVWTFVDTWVADTELCNDEGLDVETSDALDVVDTPNPTPIHDSDSGGNGGGGISATVEATTFAVTGVAAETGRVPDVTMLTLLLAAVVTLSAATGCDAED